MTPDAIHALQTHDLVLWTYAQTQDKPPTPGTVTGTDQYGVYIFWSDSYDMPTHYNYDEIDSWAHIAQVTLEQTYHPLPDERPTKRPRKKAKK